jgi:hypothetical protein
MSALGSRGRLVMTGGPRQEREGAVELAALEGDGALGVRSAEESRAPGHRARTPVSPQTRKAAANAL